jgi:uncharacterized protein (DUF58 family)
MSPGQSPRRTAGARTAGPSASGNGGREGGAAPGTPGDDLAALLRQVKRIELRTERLVSALSAGRYRSAFRGQGMEFDEVREYAAGDDVRAIDWNVTARAGKPYVKVFREERELTTFLLVDTSASMRFGAIPGVSPRAKLALAAEAAAVVGVTALRNHDRIGLMLFSDRTELHLPARKGRGHAMRLVREVLVAPRNAAPRPAGHRGVADALDELAHVAKRRAVCFLVSDFIFADAGNPHSLDAKHFADALARAGRRHDIVGLRVTDPGEESLPGGSAPIALADPEGGGVRVLALGAKQRARYAEAWAGARARTESAFRGAGCDLVDLRTERSALDALTRFFRERKRRVHG